eukprot:GFUD01015498.1.p1 GENE.GFUD01015498.1~~GFUD01015498.1.p1  ORF type:complete len:363 (+),score=97.23 GFUD01015498.1:148-1236(+)
MPLKTTVVGAWPKPDFLKIPDWFSEKGNFSSEELSGLTGMGGGYDPRSSNNAREDGNLEENIKQAVKHVIDEQVALGIDVVTDGEMERGAYYIHVMNNIKGIDMNNLEKKVMRSGAYSTLVPAVREKLSLRDGPVCFREWKRGKDLAGENVTLKFTIPGPMTICDGTVNVHYKDVDELHKDLVKCINEEILALAESGCKYIQIDEPVMMRYPDAALKYGLDNLARCFEGLPADVTKVIHLCCGYPDKLDTDEYPKAPKTNYNILAPKIDSLGFHEVSIEDAEAKNDLSLLSLFKKTKVILGAVTVARSKIETKDDIRARVSEALKYIPSDRLILAPDCGLGMLPVSIIKEKLAILTAVAKEF